ncbi:hypothetical protein [Candidatus Bathycorpusculum sp.]|jgi:hypothetical protein|nr:hypothetical protein [Candidatus Termitimicrobium sp.]MCL2685541.1 hypothetical protein [Candidatus Termitimicrobium sp.]
MSIKKTAKWTIQKDVGEYYCTKIAKEKDDDEKDEKQSAKKPVKKRS